MQELSLSKWCSARDIMSQVLERHKSAPKSILPHVSSPFFKLLYHCKNASLIKILDQELA